MVNLETFRKIALAYPEAMEDTHFDKISFRVKKKIFATYNPKNNQASVKLSLSDQDLYALIDKNIIYPVPNAWGRQGWTIVELNTIKEEIITAIVRSAYCQVAPPKLVNTYLSKKYHVIWEILFAQ
ncbi:MmcQ/YjbR family DNA-binding protein [Sphingobacterium litopenaei]|uniref:MmcQ/YjbR family DNA-binding protein n=1 Tax=Sphingobacterium litopenaei TaxID=2763500 RepID=A0ABR7YGI3_9SPHI|nr:MmcQ/YjbR family DNA-binding protein [Sphingobacterium litopenaei]MBD1430419.1 MmcQ/YjbR family DNA-binding protein [Sphingobacterium litopenaei]